jgi:hypothetical protein
MKQLDDEQAARQAIFDYFGYVEDYRILPLDDSREMFWRIDGTEREGSVVFAETEEALEDDDAGNYYSNEIYTQRFLPKWVYRGEEYTMICVDTRTDGNQYLQIFSNSKELTET